MKKYNIIEISNQKLYKNVPFITKKDYKEINNPNIVGMTKLKKCESSSDKELDLLYYDNNQYKVKEKYYGLTVGYIYVGNNNYIVLKRKNLLLFLILLLALIALLILILFPKKEENVDIPQNYIKEEDHLQNDSDIEITPPINEENENIPPTEKPVEPDNKPQEILQYLVSFDGNGGTGSMEKITCVVGEKCKLPENQFSKDGYTFIGWSKDKNGKELFDGGSEVDKLSNQDIVLYAIWEIQEFTIIFLDYDNTKIETLTFEYGEKITLPNNPVREGYTFVGWDKKLDMALEDISTMAQYETINYAINYELDGGVLTDAPTNYNVESEAIILPNPVKEGYTFVGWTLNGDEKPITDYEISTGTIGNKTFTAHYEANKYNIIFETNGANETIAPKEVSYNSKIGVLPTVTKDGYTFDGWFFNEENVTEEFIFNLTDDITLSAKWTTLDYSINYELDGGVLTDAPTNYNVESEAIILPNPVKEGYTFVGWTSNSDEKPIKDYEISTGTIGNKTFTAHYEANKYIITFDTNGANEIVEPIEASYENEIGSLPTLTKEGYTFVGWYDENNVEIFGNTIFNYTEDIILSAKWEIIKLEVNYYDMFGSLLKSEVINYGEKANFPPDPYIDGYIFIGWSPNTEIIKSNTNFIAEYTMEEYTITYDLNTGNDDDIKYIDYNIESESIVLPVPERKGYTFMGWTGSNGNKPQKEITIETGSTNDKEFIANWTANFYNVALNPNGGTVNPEVIRMAYNSTYGTLPVPTKEGYSFSGWYYDNELIEELLVMDKDYNHELVAKWDVVDYTIKYDLNGGSANNLITSYNIESDAIMLPNPSKTGYTFIGWTGSNGSTPQKDLMISTGTVGDREYIANYTINNYAISYDLVGGTANNMVSNYNVESGTITLPNPSKIGYTFVGWTGSNGSTPQKNVQIASGSTGNKNYVANYTINNYTISYDLAGGNAGQLTTSYNIETNTFTLLKPWRSGYDFLGWTGSNGTTPQEYVTINKGSTGNKSYIANWRKYNAVDYGGITLISKRNGATWSYTLDGHYNAGDTNVHSGNWIVTVDNYCAYIVGTKYIQTDLYYEFWVYKGNSTNANDLLGYAYDRPGIGNNAIATICW